MERSTRAMCARAFGAVVGAICIVVACLRVSYADVVVSTWNTDAIGNWSDGAHWSTNPVFPDNATDTFEVTIGSGATTLGSSFTIDKLTLTGGALVGTGELTVVDQTTWSGGAIGGVDATATINFNGPTLLDGAGKAFAAATLNFNGATTWTSGFISSIEPPEGGTINNAGAFDLQDDLQLNWNSTATPEFNNLAGASFTKSGGAGEGRIDAVFNNEGLVVVDSGNLWFAGGGYSGAGTFQIAAGTTLTFSDYAQSFSGQGAVPTLLDVDSVVDSQGTVIFTNFFGDSFSDVYGTFDAAEIIVNAGATGEVVLRGSSFVGSNFAGDLTLNSGTVTSISENTTKFNNITINDATNITVLDNTAIQAAGDVSLNETGVIHLGDGFTGGNLNFDGGTAHAITGNGDVVFGSVGGSIFVGGGQTLEIGPDVTIRGHSGSISGGSGSVTNLGTISSDVAGGNLSVGGVTNESLIEAKNGGGLFLNTVVNQDAITVSGGGALQASGLENDGTISVSGGGNAAFNAFQNNFAGVVSIDGGQLHFPSTWDNDGTINLTNATLLLGGNFTFDDVGTINRSGATSLRIVGTLDNVSQTLALNASTGSWRLAGGTISGGNVSATGGAQLEVSAGQLDGVTLQTSPTFVTGTALLITNGLTLSGANLDLSMGGAGSQSITFFGAAPQALAGNGIVTLGTASNVSHFSGGAVTFAPGITLQGRSGTIDGGPTGFINQGTIIADGQNLASNFIVGNLTNTGVINALQGETLNLSGSWHNAGGVVNVNNSTLRLGGTFTTADIGTIHRIGVSTVSLIGTLDNTSATLQVGTAFEGDLVMSNGVLKGGSVAPGTPASRLLVAGGVLGPGTLESVTALSADVAYLNSGGTLRLRGGVTLNGATIDMTGLSNVLSFEGTTAQTLGGVGDVLVNSGGGSATISNNVFGLKATIGSGVTIHGGGFSVQVLGNGTGSGGGLINQGTIAVETPGSQFFLREVENQGTITNVAGSQVMVSTGFRQSAGAMTIDGNLSKNTAGPLVIEGGTFEGVGVVTPAVSIGNGVATAQLATDGIFTFSSDLTIASGSTLDVDLDSTVAGAGYDQFSVAGAVTLTGSTLGLSLNFAPIVLGQQFTILSNGGSDAIVGEFSGLADNQVFDAPFFGGHVYQMRIDYDGGSNANDVVLTVASIPSSIVPGDVNFDGVVDIFDVNVVSDHWAETGPAGDANGDNIVDIFDVNLISDHWGETAGGAVGVPEPAALGIVLVALVALAFRRAAGTCTC